MMRCGVLLKPLLPKHSFSGRNGKNDRMFLEAVLLVIRTGSPWGDLPQEIYMVPGKLSITVIIDGLKKGYCDEMFDLLKKNNLKDKFHMIDSTVIRAHQRSNGKASQSIDKSCAGLTTKIHIKVNSSGLLLDIKLTKSFESDIKHSFELVQNSKCDYLLADMGYNSDAFRQKLKFKNITTRKK